MRYHPLPPTAKITIFGEQKNCVTFGLGQSGENVSNLPQKAVSKLGTLLKIITVKTKFYIGYDTMTGRLVRAKAARKLVSF